MSSMSSPPNYHEREAPEHLDEMTCMLYLERQLERTRALEVSAHTQDCAICRTLLRAMDRESRLLTRAMLEEEEPLPARIAAFQERVRRSMQWIWMVVFGLAATAVYAMYTGYIEPWEQRLEQAGFGGTSLLSLLIFQGSFWKGWQSMISLVEILALATLGGFAVIVARKRFRRGSAVALVLGGFCAAFAMPAPAAATEVRKGQTAEVRKDENIKGNVYLSGERVEVEGTVDGDVYAAGKDIEIDGHVTGDLISAGRSVWIRGQLDGNVRSAGNNLNVVGTVGKNISFFGDTIRIDEKGVVNGGVMMFGSDMNIEGRLGRDILFMGDRIDLNGVVGGSIDEKGAGLEIGSRAQVDGPIRFEGENEAIVSSGAKLASPVQFKKHVHKKEEFGRTSAFWTCVLLIAFASYGMVLFLAVPNFAQESVQSAENIGASLGLGLLVFFGVLIGSIIAMCTLIGMFVGFSSLFVWLIAVYAAQPVVGALIGQWFLGRSKETWPLIGRMMLGIFIIRIATLLPHIGWLIKLGVVLWGLGAISLALYRRFQPPAPVQAPYVPPSAPLTPLTPAGGAAV
jgi:cytoskeletal protein CcmA (bactofilin family)